MSSKSQPVADIIPLFPENGSESDPVKSTPFPASVLAKLAEDVIALNRQLNPSGLVVDEPKPVQVAALDSLKCGLKIKRESEDGDKLRRLFKE